MASIPLKALIRDEGHSFVWVVKDNRVSRRDIREGCMENGKDIVLEGLKPGETVMVDGYGGLMNGEHVEVRIQEGLREKNGNE